MPTDDATIAALLEQGDHGIGAVEASDEGGNGDGDGRGGGGDLIIVDGAAFVSSTDGQMATATGATAAQFATVCRFSLLAHSPLQRPLRLAMLSEVLDAMSPGPPAIPAIRLDGHFTDLRVRGADLPESAGTVVGFRLPAGSPGVDTPGYHLHYISDDRTVGGRVLDLTMSAGELRVGQ